MAQMKNQEAGPKWRCLLADKREKILAADEISSLTWGSAKHKSET
jgi:hypothetical protein